MIAARCGACGDTFAPTEETAPGVTPTRWCRCGRSFATRNPDLSLTVGGPGNTRLVEIGPEEMTP